MLTASGLWSNPALALGSPTATASWETLVRATKKAQHSRLTSSLENPRCRSKSYTWVFCHFLATRLLYEVSFTRFSSYFVVPSGGYCRSSAVLWLAALSAADAARLARNRDGAPLRMYKYMLHQNVLRALIAPIHTHFWFTPSTPLLQSMRFQSMQKTP